MFSIGQKVRCVDGKLRKAGLCPQTDEVLVTVGSIYTVRKLSTPAAMDTIRMRS